MRNRKQKRHHAMQSLLPLIPGGATPVSNTVCVCRNDDTWTYYVGFLPVYCHDAGDDALFRLTIAQLVASGACRPCEIMSAFGVTKNKVLRASRQLRERGVRSFFEKRRTRRGGTVLTVEKLKEAQLLLDRGVTKGEVADELCVKRDTVRKAINDGRLCESGSSAPDSQASTLSERSRLDGEAGQAMGTACTRPDDRAGAAFGFGACAETRFKTSLDVPLGGVLCTLPALLGNGLLTGLDKLGDVCGYYTQIHVLLTLALMLLCRIRTVERMRSHAPGELGELLGLDRSPEARCLRYKLDDMAGRDKAEEWAASLSRQWMGESLETPGFLYVDGHVKVYNGGEELPRRYVSRQRLCLRGISNYWINDALGLPFFVVERQIDNGLLQVLRCDIVPRLLKEVPNQPTAGQLEKNRCLCRFVIVFDREGYSPAFFKEMWEKHRIACITYRKNCTDQWPLEWFAEVRTVMPRGETVEMQLAERGTLVGTGSDAIWVKEVRKLTESGHQTAIASTAYDLSASVIAPHMFTRWCQENFFEYAMHHFPIDMLTEYKTESFSGTEKLVNPAWRQLERARSSARGKLDRRRAKFVAMDSEEAASPRHRRHERWETRKAELLEEMEHFRDEVKRLVQSKKDTAHHTTWAELPEEERFMRLPKGRRRLINTVGMIAYRAETAMASLITGNEKTFSMADARAVLQDLFVTPADIIPSPEQGTLEVRVHTASTPASNRRLAALFKHLNETETIYPETDLKMIFKCLHPSSGKA